MLFRFIGRYTNGHEAVNACGYVFEGRDPVVVTSGEAIHRLTGSIEFEKVHSLDHDGDGKPGGSLPRKRGRPRKGGE